MRNADHRKYGSLKKGFQTQHLLGIDQYPKDMTKMFEVLQSHQWDTTYSEHVKKRRQERKDQQKTSENKNNEGTTMAQNNDAICYCCGKKGHMSNNCPDKDKIPRGQWAIKKGLTMFAGSECKEIEKEEKDEDTTKKVPRWVEGADGKLHWSGAQYIQMGNQQEMVNISRERITNGGLRDVCYSTQGQRSAQW